MKRILTMLAIALAAVVCEAAPAKVPVAALKALKATRGKHIRTGIVFMDGKYIPPPYVVERYGTAIRINNIQVTGPLIPWDSFLRTQEGAKVTTSTTEIAPADGASEPEVEIEEDFDDDDPLADLFGDEPKPKKAKKAARKPAGPRKVTTTKVEFDGEFEMNAASQNMVARINSRRTVIDQKLRAGGFVFFGSNYAGTSGDAATAKKIISVLPEAMQTATSEAQLSNICRSHGLSFLSAPIIADLFENRDGYVRLVERRRKMAEEAKWNNMLNGGN